MCNWLLLAGAGAIGLKMRHRQRLDVIGRQSGLETTAIPMPPEQTGGDYYITVYLRPPSTTASYVAVNVTVDTG